MRHLLHAVQPLGEHVVQHTPVERFLVREIVEQVVPADAGGGSDAVERGPFEAELGEVALGLGEDGLLFAQPRGRGRAGRIGGGAGRRGGDRSGVRRWSCFGRGCRACRRRGRAAGGLRWCGRAQGQGGTAVFGGSCAPLWSGTGGIRARARHWRLARRLLSGILPIGKFLLVGKLQATPAGHASATTSEDHDDPFAFPAAPHPRACRRSGVLRGPPPGWPLPPHAPGARFPPPAFLIPERDIRHRSLPMETTTASVGCGVHGARLDLAAYAHNFSDAHPPLTPPAGADRGRALLLLLRGALRHGLPDGHRRAVLHPPHRAGQRAWRGARDPGGPTRWAACAPGSARRKCCASRPACAT